MAVTINDLQAVREMQTEHFTLLEELLQQGLQKFKRAAVEVSVILVDNDYIHELNLEYRGVDQPTDVLSFALEEMEDETQKAELPDGAPELLGDIYISIQRTIEQAESYGHSFERELAYLAAHGLLHLLGFDHQTPEETHKMREFEEQLLEDFGLTRLCKRDDQE